MARELTVATFNLWGLNEPWDYTGPSMAWPSLRGFLRVPEHLTGRGVGIALVDGSFASHPDVATDGRRRTYLIETSYESPRPVPLEPSQGRFGFRSARGADSMGFGRPDHRPPEARLRDAEA